MFIMNVLNRISIFNYFSSLILLYGNISFKYKIALFLRWISAPFIDIEKEIPKRGLILDIGCGHGLFDALFAYKSKSRKIIGLDPDESKIVIAKQLEKKFPNLQFKHGYFHPLDFKQKFDFIILCDVEYLLSPSGKMKLFTQMKKVLKRKGAIVLKTNHNNHTIGFFLCYFQEIIATRILSYTYSQTGLHFFTLDEYKDLFQKCGLKIIKEKSLKTTFFHPHYLFLLKKFS